MKTYEEIKAGTTLADIMQGIVFNKVEKITSPYGEDELVFATDAGYKVIFYHGQECCERVNIEDVCGDLNDLVGVPLMVANQSSRHEEDESGFESITWTFYTFRTVKGTVDVRWFGGSNGYYSERVSVRIVHPEWVNEIVYPVS